MDFPMHITPGWISLSNFLIKRFLHFFGHHIISERQFFTISTLKSMDHHPIAENMLNSKNGENSQNRLKCPVFGSSHSGEASNLGVPIQIGYIFPHLGIARIAPD
jgi:hypothetical protein